MTTDTLKISSDFTKFPGPRYERDGKFSGQRFREELLAPHLKAAIGSGGVVEVVLDGVAGYGSSFLEEAFGGLLRNGFTPEQLQHHLRIVAQTQRFKHHRIRALEYISEQADHLVAS